MQQRNSVLTPILVTEPIAEIKHETPRIDLPYQNLAVTGQQSERSLESALK